ncbi:uncharacterized protein N7496_006021 [Penicillium cataractarum]|uniref:DUF676 domain-containing protein n=1 Tax=Penicillium cataractarum TaxID=2100454 RepID=A0A9W9S2N6_9EURO|nr:uncharacterized protein N7496_006021 [Penicillium cataractarum]KAJ5369929.1 hypothetical protein N7496_006021 [Penicillium cataractarum]
MDIKSTHEANANMSEARTIDIIAVHGLDEFDARGKCSDSSWEDPLDKELDGGWLGASVREICGKSAKFTIRLFFYTFDSTNTFCASADGLSNEAYSLLEQICMNRSQEVLFLGQGLGGLLVKQALLNAFLSSDFCQVKRWTKGLAFFGTPHSRESELRSGSHKGFFESLFCSTAPGLQIPPTLSNDFRHQLEDFLYISFYGNNDEATGRHAFG